MKLESVTAERKKSHLHQFDKTLITYQSGKSIFHVFILSHEIPKALTSASLND